MTIGLSIHHINGINYHSQTRHHVRIHVKFTRFDCRLLNFSNFLLVCIISGSGLFFPNSDDVDYPTDIKGEMTTMPYGCMVDDSIEIKLCVVCGERASGFYFGALVCLPCKVSMPGGWPFKLYTVMGMTGPVG